MSDFYRSKAAGFRRILELIFNQNNASEFGTAVKAQIAIVPWDALC